MLIKGKLKVENMAGNGENESSEEDYLSKVFKNIDWDSRVKATTNRSGCISKNDFESSFTYKYLWYKMEPEQIDFDNPFEIEESNQMRPRLERRSKKKNAVEARLDLLTEQIKEIKDNKGDDEDESVEDDIIDEYGNIIPQQLQEEFAKEKSRKRMEEKTAKMNENKKVEKEIPDMPAEVKSKKTRQRVKARDLAIKMKSQIADDSPEENNDGNCDNKYENNVTDNVTNHEQKTKDNKRKYSIWCDLDEPSIQRPKKTKKGNFDLEFPRLSSLNSKDHKYFLQLQKRYKSGKLYGVSEKEYLNMLAAVQDERAEFTKFAYEYCQENRKKFEFCNPGIDKYVTEHRETRKIRVLDFPRYWKKLRDIRLCAARKEQGEMDHCYLGFQETVLQRGKIPLGTVPKPGQFLQLGTNYSRLVHKYPANPKIMPGGGQGMSRSLERQIRNNKGANKDDSDMIASNENPSLVPENTYMHKMSIIQDPNAGKLAALYVPDVIISSSALKCIMDNFYPAFSKAWEIPVHIQDYQGATPADTKRVIFIGKPFIPKQVTASDRNKLGFKYSVRSYMNKEWGTEGKSQNSSNITKPDNEISATPEEDLFSESIDELESFGQVSTKATEAIKEPKVKEEYNEELNNKESNNKEPDSPKESIAQVDGTLSSLSFTDLELQNVNLVDLMSDPDKIVFDPSTVNVDESLLAQLDGADTSDEDDDLMIDLGDNENAKTESKEKPIDEILERRSSRLRSQNTSQIAKESLTRRRTRSGQVSTENIENLPKKGKAKPSKAKATKEELKEDNSNSVIQKTAENKKNGSNNEIEHEVKSSPLLIKPTDVTTSTTENSVKAPSKQDSHTPHDEILPKQEIIAPQCSIFGQPVQVEKEVDILDSLLIGQSALHGKQQLNRDKKKKSEYNGEDIKLGAPLVGNLDEYLPPFPGYNYSYSLWNLANTEKKSSFRLLIRSKIACLTPYFGVMSPSVKLEYQTHLGAEQSTVSECCREWCDNLLRPSALTIRYRIDPENGKLLMTQKLSLKQIKEDGMIEHQQTLGEETVSTAKFDPSLQLANLHNLVADLKSLSGGTYLVSHDKKSGAFCRLYKPAQDEGEYDLHEAYTKLDGSTVTPHIKIPWKQIDYNLLTPWQIKHDRVPGTFEPPKLSKRR